MRIRQAYASALPETQEKYEWDADGNPTYKGVALIADSDDSPVWVIHYFEWTDGLPTLHKVRTGAWSARATLF